MNSILLPTRIGPQSATAPSPTRRELEIASLVMLSNADIGQALGISENTVRAHLVSLSRRLGLEGRVAIALWYERAYGQQERRAA